MSITETEIIKYIIQHGSKSKLNYSPLDNLPSASSQSGSHMKSRLEKLQHVTQQSSDFQRLLLHWGAFNQTLRA
jgi:hypothetical protein